MKMKYLAFLLALVLCASCLPAAIAQGEGYGTIKLAGLADHAEWLAEQGKLFEEMNPGTTVEIVEFVAGADMYAKITMMMQSSKTAPDVIMEDGFMINADAAAGFLEPLTAFIAETPDMENMVPAVMAGCQGPDGVQYGIPMSTDVQGIWCNKKMLAEAGVALPFAPKTWEDVLDAAEKMKAIGGDDFVPLFLYGSKARPEETSMRTFQVLYSGTGGELYDYGEGKWVVDRENLLKVYNFINDVYNVRKVGAPLSIVSQATVANLFRSDYMKNDKLGMYFSGSWECTNWGEGKKYEWPEGLDVWDFVKIPTADGSAPGYTTMSGGWAWAIPANANNKDGAKELLAFLCSKEKSMELVLWNDDLGVRQDVLTDPAYTGQAMSVVNQASEMLPYTHFRPSVEGYTAVTAVYTDTVESVVMGSATPEEAVANFEFEMRQAVGEDRLIVK